MFRTVGTPHVPQRPGRPARPPSPEEVRLVLDECRQEPQGVLRTAMNLQVNHDISYQRVYRIMKENGLVVSSAAKSKKRKWVRYERRHSNSMWHTDWHVMKDPRMKGLNLVTFLDDASRCVTGVGLFTEATSENVVRSPGCIQAVRRSCHHPVRQRLMLCRRCRQVREGEGRQENEGAFRIMVAHHL